MIVIITKKNNGKIIKVRCTPEKLFSLVLEIN